MFRKLNTSTEHDLGFFMLPKENSFQNVTFSSQEATKIYRRITLSQRFAFSVPFNFTEMV